MLEDARVKIANILDKNKTLKDLFIEFNIDFDAHVSNLVDTLYAENNLIQNNTVQALAENTTTNSDISELNENISTLFGLYPGIIGSPHETHYKTFKSDNRTSYTYLLKWIYYTYKYYNEEQFFFNNLVEKFVPNYDGEVITSTTHLKIYFDGLGILLDTLDQKIEDLYTLGDIDTVDEKYLQHIAQLLGYQKEDFSIKSISFRELIKNLIDIYQTKGTEYSFELFFKLLGFDADVREYYWDRDAQNAEQFGSIDKYDYLWYLTTQDPRTRKTQQIGASSTQPIQPINVSDWVLPKDLRDFNTLQQDYSIDQILGFRSSDLDKEDLFTYFKTNFIQFRLNQFYTKQDLTAKDTETILKYVKFLTPIYISSFVEVATTPYQDFFEMRNPEASSIVLDGYAGTPPWIDILLPFIFVTIKDYMPLRLDPADDNAVVIVSYPWTDDNSDGHSDSILSSIFGDPAIDINAVGDVALTSTVDMVIDRYIGVKLDEGRGYNITVKGNLSQTYSSLISRINAALTTAGLDATAVRVGTPGDHDIRIYSNTYGTDSKIFLAKNINQDLFAKLGTTPLAPVDGAQTERGYQDFGLSYNSDTSATGLVPTSSYNFYINIDIEDFTEVDCSGPVPAYTTPDDIISSINNHYNKGIVSAFASTVKPEYVSTDVTNNGKVFIGYRDTETNNGRLVYMNSDGTSYRSGINFTLYDCRDIAVACSKDSDVDKNLVVFYDTVNGFPKWNVFDNEGIKTIITQKLEDASANVTEIAAIGIVGTSKVAIAYNITSPSPAVVVKTVQLTGPAIVDTITINATINNLTLGSVDGIVLVGGSTTTGGIIIYLNEDLTYNIIDQAQSTKTFSTSSSVKEINFNRTRDEEVLITWIDNNDSGHGYSALYDEAGIVVKAAGKIISDELELLNSSMTSIDNIMVFYSKVADGNGYFKIYSSDIDLIKKEKMIYSSSAIENISLNLVANESIMVSISTPTNGLFMALDYFGQISSLNSENKLTIKSLDAGDTWDDTVENYAQTSDEGHLFQIGNDTYESDNFSQYHRDLGVDFTAERNRFNTFFDSSPADDLLPLIQDTIDFVFTLLVGSNDLPYENVDKTGFYIQRNGYISRNPEVNVQGNKERAYYTKHLEVSQDIKDNDYRVRKEINWPQWRQEDASYENWSSWTMALDYFNPSINWPIFDASGSMLFGGTYEGGQYFEFTAPDMDGGAIFFGTATPYGPFFEYIAPVPFGAAVTDGDAIVSAIYNWLSPEVFGSMTFDGIADTDFAQTFTYVSSGGANLLAVGDITTDESVFVPEMTGGAIFDGAAITLFGNVYIASGGMILSSGDITADEIGYVYNGTGFMLTSGTVGVDEFAITATMNDGATFAGSAEVARGIEETMNGGATFAGAADVEMEVARTMEGGAIFDGAADASIEYAFEGAGTIVPGGAAITTVEIARTMTGDIGTFGASGYQEAGL